MLSICRGLGDGALFTLAICRGLFESDKLLYAFLMAIQILRHKQVSEHPCSRLPVTYEPTE